MDQPGDRARRPRDAQKTREAILAAAETVFARHGFDGARVEAIAKTSGYNTSLLFRYFGDKAGLYKAVLQRANREMGQLLEGLLPPLAATPASADLFRTFLAEMVRTVFDYLLEHPRFGRILTWEMAAGWQTYVRSARLRTEDLAPFAEVLNRARGAGVLRSGYAPLIQMSLIVQMCQSYLAYLPLYRELFPGEDLSSDRALDQTRGFLVDLVVAGLTTDAGEKPPVRQP